MDFRISTNFICLDKLRYMWCRHARADLSCRIQKDIEKMLGPQPARSALGAARQLHVFPVLGEGRKEGSNEVIWGTQG